MFGSTKHPFVRFSFLSLLSFFQVKSVFIWPFSLQPRYDRLMEYPHRITIGLYGIFSLSAVFLGSCLVVLFVHRFWEVSSEWVYRILTLQMGMLLCHLFLPVSCFDGALVWTRFVVGFCVCLYLLRNRISELIIIGYLHRFLGAGSTSKSLLTQPNVPFLF